MSRETRSLTPPTFRQAVRQDAPSEQYWCPRYQEWLSLAELSYYKQIGVPQVAVHQYGSDVV